MGVYDLIKKDGPTSLEVSLIGKEEPQIVKIKRTKHGRWQQMARTLDALDWDRVTTLDADGNIIASYEPDDEIVPQQPLAIDNVALKEDLPEVQWTRAITAAQQAVMAPIVEMMGIVVRNQQEFITAQLDQYHAILDRIEQQEQKYQESLDALAKAKQAAKEAQGDGLNAQLMEVLKMATPGVLDAFKQSTGPKQLMSLLTEPETTPTPEGGTNGSD